MSLRVLFAFLVFAAFVALVGAAIVFGSGPICD
jgi:hypothetical protein